MHTHISSFFYSSFSLIFLEANFFYLTFSVDFFLSLSISTLTKILHKHFEKLKIVLKKQKIVKKKKQKIIDNGKKFNFLAILQFFGNQIAKVLKSNDLPTFLKSILREKNSTEKTARKNLTANFTRKKNEISKANKELH